MHITIIGGGAWGTTIGQILSDNGHTPLIYDINPQNVEQILAHQHPTFQLPLPKNVAATSDIEKAVEFASYFVLAVPTKAMRMVLKTLNVHLKKPAVFINVSKGIEPKTLKRISEIVYDEVDPPYVKGYVALTGPSHAEEMVLRKLTLLVSASEDEALAMEVQHIFANETYLRVYTSNDLIGCEVGGAVKNAIAVISGAATGYNLGENARAAIITRGIVEIIRVVEVMGGKKETAFGLTGIGDLIVTASSENSRNFQAGKKLGMGISIEAIYQEAKQTIEGFRTIEAMHDLALQHHIELPMIEVTYEIIFMNLSIKDAMQKLLSRDLKSEDF